MNKYAVARNLLKIASELLASDEGPWSIDGWKIELIKDPPAVAKLKLSRYWDDFLEEGRSLFLLTKGEKEFAVLSASKRDHNKLLEVYTLSQPRKNIFDHDVVLGEDALLGSWPRVSKKIIEVSASRLNPRTWEEEIEFRRKEDRRHQDMWLA